MNKAIREVLDNSDRAYDPFGAAMQVMGAMCDLLEVNGTPEFIPAAVGYRPALGLTAEVVNDDWTAAEFLDLLGAETIDYFDMRDALLILDRYIGLLVVLGRDY